MVHGAEGLGPAEDEFTDRSLMDELDRGFKDENSTVDKILEILQNSGRNFENEKLREVILDHLDKIKEYRRQDIDADRIEEDIEWAVDDAMFWSQHK